MSEIRQFPAREDVEANTQKSRLAFLLESLAIVALAALAAYAASA
jgi:hypothetical protein